LFSSTREKDEALKFVSGKDIAIIPNLLVLPNSVMGTYIPEEHFKIIFLGRIDPAKNIELLLKALMTDSNLPFQLKIVGSGEEEYVSKLKKISSGFKNIEWIGHVDGNEKFKLLVEADLLVLPSHTENFGNVILEALSQGTPVLTSDNVGAKEYILDNNLGWVVKGEAAAWKEQLNYIWNHKRLRDEIRLNAPQCIARDFRTKNQLEAYLKLYQKHCSTRKPGE
jgi:glycosyltransferase involved in cell wall biosynthesis